MTGRSRLICGLLAGLAVLVLATYVRDWAVVAPQTPLNRTSDFAGTYVAATLWREGRGAQIYDLPVETQALRATGAPADHSDIPFENPPAALLLALPATLVNGGAAWALWSWLQVLLMVAAVAVAARAAPWPARAGPARLAVSLAALAGVGTALLFLEGQWDGFAAFGLAGGYALWRRDRSFAAGLVMALGIGVAKPHLALGLAAFVIGRRDWRAAGGALAGAVALLLASVAAVGVGGVESYVGALLQPSNSPVREMLGFSGLFGSTLGPGRLTDVLTVAGGAAALAAAYWVGARARREPALLEPALFAATVLSLLASPHLLGHDLTLLVPVLVAVLGWLACRAPGWPDAASAALIASWIVLSGLALVDLAGQQAGGAGVRLVPWALICLGCGSVLAVLELGERAAGPSGGLLGGA
ncbi:MAG: glycosyltransferase family 87 protein [Candidatus Dormibacteria bacterium]|jgi:hypothetical protein